ncbi:hypothetical protein JCGZ_15603 [Jatropha curcas]|uniref:Rrn7/TAF1B N-terminal cyclin domain-containing protein n=1 Tax=Jatropha curcas TaxID=180498 RepID=A0A067KYB5_JATCU|nr:TATA box-binding protein-associated factor RNA polymerase I subunit B [Jatropha curcas]KDP41196.1 hypothetical protein JCGZ_15603 [Jatropha curcas]
MDHKGEEKWACRRCGHVGLDESDGFYYCQECGAQADDIILTGVADDDVFNADGGSILYSARRPRLSQHVQNDPSSQAWLRFTQEEEDNKTATKIEAKRETQNDYNYSNQNLDGVGPMEPDDFGSRANGKLSYEEYYNEVRFRYVMGMQWMIQLQCEALVEKFNASPLICGIAGTVWLRYLYSTGVYEDGWADEVLLESETQTVGKPTNHRPRNRKEPHNAYGQRAVNVWFQCLRKKIPLSHSLAISFLSCHVAREAILPTDILKWSLEGKLPYFDAHVEIEKRFERASAACPISSSLMFRPSQTVPVQNLEPMAARIAESIGLHLPPVNFYKIAARYLKKLSLPVEEVLPHALRIYEWSLPPDLWLSTSELRLPTRICVMSILIVAIRMLYNINGFGAWERSLLRRKCSASRSCHTDALDSIFTSEMEGDAGKFSASFLHRMDDSGEKFIRNPSHVQKPGLGSAELLLHHLEATYTKIVDTYEFAKDLPSYLQYCKDVVFAGAGPSRTDYRVEEELIDKLWDFYQNEQESELAQEPRMPSNTVFNQKRSRNDDECVKNLLETKEVREGWHDSPSGSRSSTDNPPECSRQQSLDNDQFSNEAQEDQNLECSKDSEEALEEKEAIRRLKLDMEENRFCYIAPRAKLKRFDYLHYTRKRGGGALTYVAHADYYILLRSCARVVQVDIRLMHIGVLSFEKRLAWLEERTDHCLHLTPPSMTCKFCRDMPDSSQLSFQC